MPPEPDDPTPRRWGMGLAILVVTALIFAAGGWLLFNRQREDRAVSAQATAAAVSARATNQAVAEADVQSEATRQAQATAQLVGAQATANAAATATATPWKRPISAGCRGRSGRLDHRHCRIPGGF